MGKGDLGGPKIYFSQFELYTEKEEFTKEVALRVTGWGADSPVEGTCGTSIMNTDYDTYWYYPSNSGHRCKQCQTAPPMNPRCFGETFVGNFELADKWSATA